MEHGRIRVCDHLLVSLNRSWQVHVEPGQRPVAAFKAMAPLALASTSPAITNTYLAAVASHDAFWLGFEADEGTTFAVTVDVDGENVLIPGTSSGPSEGLTFEPRNFLLAPDQPWLDAAVVGDGTFAQLLPRPGLETQVRIVIYRVDDEWVQARNQPLEDPVPQYSGAASDGNAMSQHPWQAREFREDAPTPDRCGELLFRVVDPNRFEALTETQLPSGMFDDADNEPPAPFDPFA